MEAQKSSRTSLEWMGMGATMITALRLPEAAPPCLRTRGRLADLKARGFAYFHGEGQGTDPQWAPEAFFLALGLTRQAAIALGGRYEQNAIVHAGDDAVPRLLLLR